MARKRRRNAPWRPRLLGGAALVAVAACAVALRRRCDGAAHVVVKDGVRWLVQGGDVIGAAYLGHPDYAAFRGWAVQRVAAAARPAAANALVVGVGAGSVVNHLRRTLDADAVELDADVARLATEHFGVEANSVHCGDGVALLRTAGRRYDLVLVDVVDPSSAATTVAALDAAVATPRVAAGGLLVLNVVALDDAEGLEFLRFVASALARRFAVVRAVRDSPPEDAGATNVVFFASDDAVDWPAPAERPEVGSQEWVAAHVAAWELVSCHRGACDLAFRGVAAAWRAAEGPPRPGPAYDARAAANLANLTAAFLPAADRVPPRSACAARLWRRYAGPSPCAAGEPP